VIHSLPFRSCLDHLVVGAVVNGLTVLSLDSLITPTDHLRTSGNLVSKSPVSSKKRRGTEESVGFAFSEIFRSLFKGK
jgi:hypothetical protein